MNNQRVRLLIVSHSLSGGGAERFTSTLIANLNRNKFEVLVCLVYNKISYFVPNYILIKVLNKQKFWHLGRVIINLQKTIDQFSPHIVLSTIADMSRITGLALKLSKIKPNWVARIGNNPALANSGWQKLLNEVWNKYIFSGVDQFIANSKGLALGFSAFYPNVADKVNSIYNPVDYSLIDRLSQDPVDYIGSSKEPVILSVGRLHQTKRPDILLAAFDRLRRRLSAKLVICGAGPLQDKLAQEVTSRGLNDYVRLLGFQSNPYALMRQATLFVMTSDHEGLPNALIEAQGLGLPAVATNCPYGPDEIIENGKTGILTKLGDSQAIAESMERVLLDSNLREKMGIAARKRSRKLFDLQSNIKKWEQLLRVRPKINWQF